MLYSCLFLSIILQIFLVLSNYRCEIMHISNHVLNMGSLNRERKNGKKVLAHR